MNTYQFTPKPGQNIQPLLAMARQLDIEIETLRAPSREASSDGYISVDEFCDELRARIRKRYADARSAGIPIGQG